METNFGGWAIEEALFRWIRENLPAGKTILELGSGTGTEELTKHYTVYSVEHDFRWLNKYKSIYIHAPIKRRIGWYNPRVLKKELPAEYDLILVDGPPGSKTRSRMGFFRWLHLFRTDVPIVIDDMQDTTELMLFENLEQELNRKGFVFEGEQKKFGVILP